MDCRDSERRAASNRVDLAPESSEVFMEPPSSEPVAPFDSAAPSAKEEDMRAQARENRAASPREAMEASRGLNPSPYAANLSCIEW